MFACYMYVQTLTLTPSPLLRRCVMINSSFLIGPLQTSNFSWNLIQWIKYIKSSASELIRKCLFQFGRAQPFFLPIQGGNFDFGSTFGTALIQTLNFFCTKHKLHEYYHNMFSKQFDQNEYFSTYCSLRNEMERNETKWIETRWKSVVCEMRICSLRNENL